MNVRHVKFVVTSVDCYVRCSTEEVIPCTVLVLFFNVRTRVQERTVTGRIEVPFCVPRSHSTGCVHVRASFRCSCADTSLSALARSRYQQHLSCWRPESSGQSASCGVRRQQHKHRSSLVVAVASFFFFHSTWRHDCAQGQALIALRGGKLCQLVQ